MRRVIVVSAALAAVGALGGCEADGGIAGPNRGAPFVFGGQSAASADTAVLGSWTRTVTAIDETGAPRISETVWTFNSDGSAVRSMITRDAFGGLVDRQEAFGRWTVEGNQVVIDFSAPFTGRVPLPFQRSGETLVLGGQTFIRRL
jgi:hypothetical protein